MNAVTALNSNDTQLRNAAIVYLHHDKGYSATDIHKIVNLAVATLKSYFYKFKHLLKWARDIFEEKIIKKSKQYWVYIDKITMQDGSVLCKIGNTTQSPHKRAKQLKWKVDGVTVKPASVEVKHAIECKDYTSMHNMEDCLRIGMTLIDPDGYIQNDRLNSWEEDYPIRILNNPFVRLGLEQFAA